MDLLSSVLRELRFESAGYRRLELSAPWAVSFHQTELRGMHLVLAGRCELVLDDGSVLGLGPRDLVLAPRADPHVLRSPGARTLRPVPAAELASAERGLVRAGGGGESTRILCGAFRVELPGHPALAALPRLIHVPAAAGASSWLDAFEQLLELEGQEPGPGSEVVMTRLSDALLARALREQVSRPGSTGWLRALGDSRLGPALHAMHERLESPWTVASLARRAGLSRAAFARRFSAQVGLAPMEYLLGVRMVRAMALLQDGEHALAAIAARTGYGSEAAFSSAFKRFTGLSPGTYRRQRSTSRRG